MGGAILSKLISSNPENHSFFIVDPGMDERRSSEFASCSIYLSFAECIEDQHHFDVIFLSVKPQIFTSISLSFSTVVHSETIIISVMVGISCQTNSEIIPDSSQIIRCMPSVGALKGYSASVNFSEPGTTTESRKLAEDLLSRVGSCGWVVKESDMHAVTGVSGSGPAYFFAFVEALSAAGSLLGLDKQLAIDTLIGAAELLKSNRDPSALREMVTSPNGTTQAALETLAKENALNHLVAAAVDAAAQRSVELSGSE